MIPAQLSNEAWHIFSTDFGISSGYLWYCAVVTSLLCCLFPLLRSFSEELLCLKSLTIHCYASWDVQWHPLLEPLCLLSFKHNSWKVIIVLVPELSALFLRTIFYITIPHSEGLWSLMLILKKLMPFHRN